MVYLLPIKNKYLDIQPFDLERTWWRLFKKHVVRTKLYLLFKQAQFTHAETTLVDFPVENLLTMKYNKASFSLFHFEVIKYSSKPKQQ